MTKAEFVTALSAQIPGYVRITVDQSEAALMATIANAAADFVEDATGTYVPWDNGRAMIVALSISSDMYDKRTYTGAAIQNVTRLMMDDFLLQLKLKARMAEQAALAAEAAT